MLLLVLMLLNPCHPGDTIGDDTAAYPGFNGYHYVYSVNKPALYTDTYLLDDLEQVIGHIPLPTPLGTYGPAHRIVVCYNPDIQNLIDDGRWEIPVSDTTTSTTLPPTDVPEPGLKANPAPHVAPTPTSPPTTSSPSRTVAPVQWTTTSHCAAHVTHGSATRYIAALRGADSVGGGIKRIDCRWHGGG